MPPTIIFVAFWFASFKTFVAIAFSPEFTALAIALAVLWLILLFATMFLMIDDLLPTILFATLLRVLLSTFFVNFEAHPAIFPMTKFDTTPFTIPPAPLS